MLRALAAFLLAPLLPVASALAAGLVIPDEPDLPPIALVRHDVRVEIESQAASTRVEQVFQNNTRRRLEAQYLFPVPAGAAMSGFAILVDGREVRGELVGKDKARSIYEEVVQRSGETALLEYLRGEVFRARIFPIEPDSRVQVNLSFHQVLEAAGGPAGQTSLVRYVYPLHEGGRRGPSVHGDFKLEAVIRSPVPIQNLYSPSHDVAVDRIKEGEVRVSCRDHDTTLSRDFHLYYGVSGRRVGLELLTYRPDSSQPGYFLMLVSPRSGHQERIVARDLVFVVDTSGSMEGEKIRQVRSALRYCITHLHDEDRFALVRFSTDVYPWSPALTPVTGERRRLALDWVEGLTAQGGTDIAGALERALSYRQKDVQRPFYVVFLTDGKPTLGATVDPRGIVAGVEQAVKAAGEATVRVFTWGVGYDVDPPLLDGIAAASGGVSEYVRPEEDVSTKLSAFYNRTSHPVLTGLTLELEGTSIVLRDLQPGSVPDLYAGSQLVMTGRYTGEGETRISLSGRVNETAERFEYTARFPSRDPEHRFVELLWARRQVGYLLDSIRLRGENRELVDEVVRLSMQYGIQTPYTSYLILEDGTRIAANAPSPSTEAASAFRALVLARENRGALAGPSRARARLKLDELALDRQERLAEGLEAGGGRDGTVYFGAAPAAAAPGKAGQEAQRRRQNEAARSLADGFLERGGKASVDAAAYLGALKLAPTAQGWAASATPAPFRTAASTRFYPYRGLWVDERFEDTDEVTVVKFASPAYFRLVDLHPEVIDAFKLSRYLLYRSASGKALVIAPEGARNLSDEEIAALFRAAR